MGLRRFSIWQRVAWRRGLNVSLVDWSFIGRRAGLSCGKSGVIGRYIYRPIDSFDTIFFVMTSKKRLTQYQQLLQQLSGTGWISEGYAQNRGPGAGGPCFQWTRKVKGKTISVALSEEQFKAMQQAIDNWKRTKKIIKRMQQLSREEIFTTLPGTKRRKPLHKKVLGII